MKAAAVTFAVDGAATHRVHDESKVPPSIVRWAAQNAARRSDGEARDDAPSALSLEWRAIGRLQADSAPERRVVWDEQLSRGPTEAEAMFQNTIDELRRQLAEAEERCAAQSRAADAFSRDNESAQRTIDQQNKLLNKLRTTIHTLEEELDDFRHNPSVVKVRVTAEGPNGEEETEVELDEHLCRASREELRVRERTIGDQMEELERMEAKLTEGREQILRLEVEGLTQGASEQEVAATLEDECRQNKELKQRIARLEQTRSELNAKLAKLQSKKNALNGEARRAKARLQRKARENDQLMEEVLHLEKLSSKALERKADRQDALEKRSEVALAKLQDETATNRHLRKQVAALTQQAAKEQSQLAELRTLVADLRSKRGATDAKADARELEDMRKLVAELRADVQRERSEREALQRKMEQLAKKGSGTEKKCPAAAKGGHSLRFRCLCESCEQRRRGGADSVSLAAATEGEATVPTANRSKSKSNQINRTSKEAPKIEKGDQEQKVAIEKKQEQATVAVAKEAEPSKTDERNEKSASGKAKEIAEAPPKSEGRKKGWLRTLSFKGKVGKK
ncbi:hypothetical protein ACHAXT_008989 [Thalassiosira profunda]